MLYEWLETGAFGKMSVCNENNLFKQQKKSKPNIDPSMEESKLPTLILIKKIYSLLAAAASYNHKKIAQTTITYNKQYGEGSVRSHKAKYHP